MSHKVDYSKEKDTLAELFRQKLENHEVPVDDNGWGKIRRQLSGSRKLTFWGVFCAISAAVVALLFILSPSEELPLEPLQGESSSAVLENQNKESIAACTTPSQTQSAEGYSENAKVTDKRDEITEHTNAAYSFAPKNSTIASVRKPGDEIKENSYTHEVGTRISEVEPSNNVIADDSKVSHSSIEALKEEAQEAEKKEIKEKTNIWGYRVSDFEGEPVVRRKKDWAIAAVYNGGASPGSSTDVIPSGVRFSASGEAQAATNFIDRVVGRSLTDENHLPEFSFSFRVSKKISNRLAVESGVAYTYLQSKFKWVDPYTTYDQKQYLHYLGIPVNLTVNLFDGSSKWNAYASGGVMLEKGLRAVYNETSKDKLGKGSSSSSSESISGVQWSINASIGATYRLSEDFSLFLAPRLSYYFDNDQPKSIRTDKELSFGVTAGLKFEL